MKVFCQTSNHIHIQIFKVIFLFLVDFYFLRSCFAISYSLFLEVCQLLFYSQVLDVNFLGQNMSFVVVNLQIINLIVYLCDKSDWALESSLHYKVKQFRARQANVDQLITFYSTEGFVK